VSTGAEAAERVVRLLSEHSLTLALAESCTGGLISHLITNIAGSSRCSLGGIVAYHSLAKQAVLGVPEATLRQHGSVSAEAAALMAEGALERLAASIALAVTGIAGPGGGSPEKPVGTVYFALAARDGSRLAIREHFIGDRESYKDQAAARALHLIEEHLVNSRY
jgi:PncC family amidohydrolase